MAYDVHVTPTFQQGDEIELFPRTADYFAAEIAAKPSGKLKVSSDLTVSVVADAGRYWLAGDGKSVAIEVPEGHAKAPAKKSK